MDGTCHPQALTQDFIHYRRPPHLTQNGQRSQLTQSSPRSPIIFVVRHWKFAFSYSHLFPVVNSAVANTHVLLSLWRPDLVSFVYVLRRRSLWLSLPSLQKTQVWLPALNTEWPTTLPELQPRESGAIFWSLWVLHVYTVYIQRVTHNIHMNSRKGYANWKYNTLNKDWLGIKKISLLPLPALQLVCTGAPCLGGWVS